MQKKGIPCVKLVYMSFNVCYEGAVTKKCLSIKT